MSMGKAGMSQRCERRGKFRVPPSGGLGGNVWSPAFRRPGYSYTMAGPEYHWRLLTSMQRTELLEWRKARGALHPAA
jgi:hypothetical protein